MQEAIEKLAQVMVGGVALAVSRDAQIRAEVLKVGDAVRILKKGEVHTGVLVGFEPFKTKPAMIVCYIENEYGTHKLKLLTYTEDTQDCEVIAAQSGLSLTVERAKVLDWFNAERRKKHAELDELDAKQRYFERYFGQLFAQIEDQAA